MKTCSVEGCNEKHHCKGFCDKHYKRFLRYGDPLSPVKELPKRLPLPTVKCAYCGKEFKPRRDRRRKSELSIYCSKECANKARWKVKICKYCGKEYLNGEGYNQVYCSKECRDKDYTKVCAVCSKRFVALKKTATICYKDECQKEYTRQRSKEYEISKHQSKRLVCKECGKVFLPEYGDQRRVYCSDECAKRAYRKTDAYRVSRSECNKRRRARMRNVAVEIFGTREIFDRDNWICQICGGKVNKHLKWPHPKSASLDHVIPISKGGTHTRDNVQLAHLICNTVKGDGNIALNDGGQMVLAL